MTFKIKGKAVLYGESEERELTVLLTRGRKRRKDFFIGENRGFIMLHLLDLTRHEYRVIFYLLGNMEYGNYCYLTQSAMSEELGIAQPNISKTIKSLQSKGLLFKEKTNKGNAIRLNACIAWRGRDDKEYYRRYAIDSEYLLETNETWQNINLPTV